MQGDNIVYMAKSDLNASQILELEFHYAQETASQAINDRYTMLNFYIGIVTATGSICAGLISTQAGSQLSYVASAGLLLTAALVGWVFVAIMIRLRQAWLSSLESMNNIKQLYVSTDPEIGRAFRWSNSTLPLAHKPWSIHYFSTLLIVSLNTLCLSLGAGLYLFANQRRGVALVVSIGIFLVSLILQLWTYRKVLRSQAG